MTLLLLLMKSKAASRLPLMSSQSAGAVLGPKGGTGLIFCGLQRTWTLISLSLEGNTSLTGRCGAR